MRLSPQEFFEYRLTYFWDAWAGYHKERDEQIKFTGNLTRRAVVEIFNTQVAEGDRVKHPEQFWSFPWDEEVQPDYQEDPEKVIQHNQMLLDTLKNVINERRKQT